MAEKIEEQLQEAEAEAKLQADSNTSTITMSEMEQTPQVQEKPSPEALKKPGSISFSIWPPAQKTRDAVVERLIETLTAPSVLSKRYGTVPNEEASQIAKRIEEEAFNAAGQSAPSDRSDAGIEILQAYSKEVSRRMLEAVKSRSAATPAPESDKLDAPPADGEETPAAETEP